MHWMYIFNHYDITFWWIWWLLNLLITTCLLITIHQFCWTWWFLKAKVKLNGYVSGIKHSNVCVLKQLITLKQILDLSLAVIRSCSETFCILALSGFLPVHTQTFNSVSPHLSHSFQFLPDKFFNIFTWKFTWRDYDKTSLIV